MPLLASLQSPILLGEEFASKAKCTNMVLS